MPTTSRGPLLRNPRVIWRLAALALVGLALLTVAVAVGHDDAWLRSWVGPSVPLAAAALVGLRSALVPAERRLWLPFALGVGTAALVGLLGEVRAGWAATTGATVLTGLVWFVGAYVGVGRLVRQRLRSQPGSLWLDGLLGVLAFGALMAVLADGAPRARFAAGTDALTSLAGLGLPIFDALLLVAVGAGLVILGPRTEPRLWHLGLGFGAQALHDVLTGVELLGGQPSPTWVGVLPIAAAVLIGAAAWHRTPAWEPRTDAPGWIVVGVPVAAVGVLAAVVASAGVHPLPVAAVALVVPAMAAVALRFALTLRDTRRSAASVRLALTDDLTGLANRRAFTAAAQELLAGLGQPGRPGRAALLMVDLDRFKEVNDSLGHAAGDLLLVELGARLAALPDAGAVVARLGGDEFAVLLPGADRAAAQDTCGTVLAALGQPVEVGGVLIQSGASIGVALAPEHGQDPSGLQRRADIALYRAKAEGSGHAVFDATLGDHRQEDRLHRTIEVREAVVGGGLVVHYQPKVHLLTGRVSEVEALVRWDRPGSGIVLPGEFLPLAETAGLMPAITAQVLERALSQVAAWADDGLDLTVAVNLPVTALAERGTPGQLRDLLWDLGVAPQRLMVEVSEESSFADRPLAIAVLGAVRALGVRVAIDDFGRGYSSLGYLRDLPVDELKLDRSLVAPVAADPRAAAIVRGAIDIAHTLDLRIVAEGVEHPDQADVLMRAGCDSAQGFLFTPALPAAELREWLTSRGSGPGRVTPAASTWPSSP